jgi:TPR repeat protein
VRLDAIALEADVFIELLRGKLGGCHERDLLNARDLARAMDDLKHQCLSYTLSALARADVNTPHVSLMALFLVHSAEEARCAREFTLVEKSHYEVACGIAGGKELARCLNGRILMLFSRIGEGGGIISEHFQAEMPEGFSVIRREKANLHRRIFSQSHLPSGVRAQTFSCRIGNSGVEISPMRATHFLISVLLLSAMPAACQSTGTPPIPELAQHAESGDAQAQFELGRAYEDGKGVAQDDEQAVQWFRKSADQGNAQAQNALGVMYALGRGVQRDKEEAVRWYKKAAKQGLAEGIYNVAISYYNGEGVEGNLGLAGSWMMAAQRKGDAQAADALKQISEELNNRMERSKFDLAALYEKGDELAQDFPAAISLYMEFAHQDHKASIFASPAQYKLCQLYAVGRGVPQDYGQARDWCKKSELPFAYIVLGRMAEKGLGQQKSTQDALDFYRNAAVLGVPDGYMNTARLETESGSPEGEKKAYFWYLIATKYKIPGSDTRLAEAATHPTKKRRPNSRNK